VGQPLVWHCGVRPELNRLLPQPTLKASHFSEESADCGGNCQVCDASHQTPTQRDIRKEAQAVVSVLAKVESADKRLTLNQLIQAWRTSKDAQEQALAKAGSKDDNERLIGALIQAGVLMLDFGFNAYATNAYVKSAPLGLQGGRPLLMTEGPSATSKTRRAPLEQMPAQKSRKEPLTTTERTDGSHVAKDGPPGQSQAKKARKMPQFMTEGTG